MDAIDHIVDGNISSHVVRRPSASEKDIEDSLSESKVGEDSEFERPHKANISSLEIDVPPIHPKNSFSSLSVSRLDVQAHFSSASHMIFCCCYTSRVRRELWLYILHELRTRFRTWASYIAINVFVIVGQVVSETNLGSSAFHTNTFSFLVYAVFHLAIAGAAVFMYFMTFLSSPGFVQKNANRYSVPDSVEPSQSLEFPMERSKSVPENLKTKSRLLEERQKRAFDDVSIDMSSSRQSKRIEVKLNPMESKRSYCRYCEMWKAPRSYHCKVCKRCVARFDHHCPFFANCVGGKNHRFFWWFLLLQFATIVLTSRTVVLALTEQSDSLDEQIPFFAYEMVCITILIMFGIVNLILLGFHSYLAVTDQTTYEILRRNDQIQVLRSWSWSRCRIGLKAFCKGELDDSWIAPQTPALA